MMNPSPLPESAVQRFHEVLQRAGQAGLNEPTAVTLATLDEQGFPDARIVLVRGWDARGFCFFTNYESAKALQLSARPRAALCFYWDPLHEQVRVQGEVQRTSEQESDAYWAQRPRGSRIGAWASRQSRPLADREELEAQVAAYESRFQGENPPRPEFWGGYRVIPHRIEFWEGRPSRLHDRLVFRWDSGRWSTQRLYP